MTWIIYALMALVAIIVIWLIAVYNGLITSKNRLAEAWSDIDVQLKRRYDLIPNLVETVKGYATHEQETLEKVIEARNQAIAAQNSGDLVDQQQAENNLSGLLRHLFALSENYPDLKANQNFLELQRELTDTEDKIQAARRFYNGNVRDFNTKLQLFPTNIFAKKLGFSPAEFFEIKDDSQRETVKVNF
ncbi:MAG TPA: LemA family protein [bacterium]|jgi:LemA protein|nr:LemA family protein [bacterium]HNZ51565.1 LemA family protein [bacterium]HOF79481.1 LemA family protein [bacterium]HOH85248.1 LemA family protein [bacterium]HOQ91960.1 LemA family protein [bacterium]